MKQQESDCVIAALVKAQSETMAAMVAHMSELVAMLRQEIASAEQSNPRMGIPPGVPLRS